MANNAIACMLRKYKTMLTQNDVIETVRNYAHDIETHGIILHIVILYAYDEEMPPS